MPKSGFTWNFHFCDTIKVHDDGTYVVVRQGETAIIINSDEDGVQFASELHKAVIAARDARLNKAGAKPSTF